MRALSIVLAAALSGCTWVSKADLDERLPNLDDDGDGVDIDDGHCIFFTFAFSESMDSHRSK